MIALSSSSEFVSADLVKSTSAESSRSDSSLRERIESQKWEIIAQWTELADNFIFIDNEHLLREIFLYDDDNYQRLRTEKDIAMIHKTIYVLYRIIICPSAIEISLGFSAVFLNDAKG